MSFPASPTAMGPSQDEGYSIPRRNIRPGQAAAPPSYAASAVGGMGFREAGCLRRVWMESSGRRRVGGVVGPRSGDGAIAGQRVPLRQRMRAALKLLFAPATTAGG